MGLPANALNLGDSPLLQPGQTCWRVVHADRSAVLVDAQAYFTTLADAIRRARRQIVIVAWDIDSRVELEPVEGIDKGRFSLGRVIEEALRLNPALEIHILCWDFAMVYALERQLFPELRSSFRHPRVHFVLDAWHPFGACHHQKIVVIDGKLAFTGGLDLCLRRWDSRRHLPFDRRRRDHAGGRYHPFHDVQMMVEGEAARSLLELADDRWRQATGAGLPPCPADELPVWPASLRPDFEDHSLAIARTYFTRPPTRSVREVERLFEASISAARRHVYIENQYFTSNRIADAICARLSQPDCPEFLILLPRFNSGWLEEGTMGVIRSRLIRRIRAADVANRVRFVYPIVRGMREIEISLHSKVMVVDDRLLRIGSANLSNRSMGLDTECDLAIEGTDPGTSDSIARVRSGLLGEHLGADPAQVREWTARTGSLFAVVDRFGSDESRARIIRSFPDPGTTRGEALRIRLTPEAEILDPDRPAEEDPFFSQFLPQDRPRFLRTKDQRLRLRLAVLLTVGLALSSPGVRKDPRTARLVRLLAELGRGTSRGAPAPVALFVAGAAAHVPSDVLVFLTCVSSRRFRGWWHAAVGLSLVAALPYAAGRAMRAANPDQADQSADRQGDFWAHVLLQLNLIAPLVQVSYRAGRTGSRAAAFAGGTLVGNAARIATGGWLAESLRRAVSKPTAGNRALLVAAGLSTYLAFRWSSKRFLPTYGSALARERRGAA
jgi:phospholipase D1/2